MGLRARGTDITDDTRRIRFGIDDGSRQPFDRCQPFDPEIRMWGHTASALVDQRHKPQRGDSRLKADLIGASLAGMASE